MPSIHSRINETHRDERTRRSLIKPHLLNLSGSGLTLDGIIIERDLEHPNADTYSAPPSSKHVIVLHSDNPATLKWSIDGRRKEALFSEGDAIVNPAGLFVAPGWSGQVELLLLAINPAFVNRIAEEMNRPGKVELMPRFQFRDELLQQLARNLIAEFEQDSPPDRVYAESLTHTLIAHLLRKYSIAGICQHEAKHGLSQRRLARVLDYIDANLGEKLSLKSIADIAEISPSYFIALFKRSTGLAPHQYVMSQRIGKAKALLMQTKMPIAEIAGQTGFADQSHLTRLMRRHTGLTPKILRSD
ncbi:MAG TPA: AraC family transcriptional regulator [Nitrospiraceae bacterium]|nr:AraC family transcriptional regulator [Nitrospiraceae bacterium]